MRNPPRRPSQLVLGLLISLVLLLSQQAALLHLLGHAVAEASASAGGAHDDDGDAGHPCAQCLVAAALSHGLATAVWALLALTLAHCAFIARARASVPPRFEFRYWVNGPPARR